MARRILLLLTCVLRMSWEDWTTPVVDAFSVSPSHRWNDYRHRNRRCFRRARDAMILPQPLVAGETSKSTPRDDDVNGSSETTELEEVDELRERAKELLAEARALEVSLSETRTDSTKRRNEEYDALIEQLFSGNATSVQVSERLVDERWSPDQLMLVLERLHERQVKALGRSAGTISSDNAADFQIAATNDVAAAEPDEQEWTRLDAYVESLLLAASILDDQTTNHVNKNHRWTGRVAKSLSSRLKELRRTDEQNFQRKVAVSVNTIANSNANVSLDEYMSDTLGTRITVEETTAADKSSFNITRIMDQIALVPLWIPSSLFRFLVASKSRVESDDVKTIHDDVLAGTSFYCTSFDSIPGAAIFRGNVRTPYGVVNTTKEYNHTGVVFEDIQDRLATAGLSDRIQLFFCNDPAWRSGKDAREPSPKPVILALPKDVAPGQRTEGGSDLSFIFEVLSTAITLLTTLAYSISCYSLNPSFFSSIVKKNDVSVLTTCIPIFVGVLGLQAIHDAAQFFMAKRTGIKTGFPVLLPSFQVGTFGSVVPLRSFPASRTALLDFALSGPLTGMLASVVLMAGGVFATVYASSVALSQFPVVPVTLLKASYLVGTILSFLAPKTMLLPLSQPVPVHPCFMIGFAGMVSNALSLLPIGRLDGGRAYTAIFGSRNASVASNLTLFLVALLWFSGMSNIAIFWCILLILFQRQKPEIPIRNEVTDVDDVRVGVYVGALALAVMALAPFPNGQGML